MTTANTNPFLAMVDGLKAQAAAAATAPEGKKALPKSQVWANIGVETTNAEGEPVFISLPMGVAIDTMEPAKLPSRAGAAYDLFDAKNGLLKMLQEAAAQLQPGEGRIVQLQVQLQRVNAPVEREATAANPLLAGLNFKF